MDEATYARIEGNKVVGEAILYMRSRPPNPDGTIGFMVRPEMREWQAWEAYFETNGMHRRLSLMRQQGKSGFMVPAQVPTMFDPSWRYQPTQRDTPRTASEMSVAEREAIVARVISSATFRPKVHGRYAQEDARIDQPSPPVARELTDVERESMARLMRARYREAAE
jgi:hypothetical protein